MDSMYDLECILFNSKSSVKGTEPLLWSIVETGSLEAIMEGNSKSNNKCVGVGVDYNASEC